MARKRKWHSLSKVSKTPRLFKDYLVEDNWKRKKNRDKLDATNIKGKTILTKLGQKMICKQEQFPIADFLG